MNDLPGLLRAPRRCLQRGLWLVLMVCASMAQAQAQAPEAGSAQALRDMHRKLADRLAHSPLRRPMHLDSSETSDGLQGDVYAVVDHPIDDVRRAFGGSSQWCEMLILHINNRRCRVVAKPDGDLLTLSVVRRYDLPLTDAFELSFVHRVESSAPDYLAVDLSAPTGPLGTSHYHVVLEATPLGERQSFLHFGYAYDHNMMARLATMAYLATFGSHKVGFTIVGKDSDGRPDFIRGPRGLMERNAMRYFLTLDAYIEGSDAPKDMRADERLRRWFEGAEQYPAQLHEIDLATYMALKREDRQRDATVTR